MVRSLSLLVTAILFTTAASAGPMSLERQVAARAPAQRYVVSANLNKLVFWHLPERGEVKTQR